MGKWEQSIIDREGELEPPPDSEQGAGFSGFSSWHSSTNPLLSRKRRTDVVKTLEGVPISIPYSMVREMAGKPFSSSISERQIFKKSMQWSPVLRQG